MRRRPLLIEAARYDNAIQLIGAIDHNLKSALSRAEKLKDAALIRDLRRAQQNVDDLFRRLSAARR